jgi:peptidoglycan/LPS O-acetylase OafA/YrhL
VTKSAGMSRGNDMREAADGEEQILLWLSAGVDTGWPPPSRRSDGVEPETEPMTTRFDYRPALDGIRAIAVLSVVVYHLNGGWLAGGYLGVDVFFVLSGYLITSLMIIEYRGSGMVSLAGFWARRARRLLPALVTMIIGVSVYYGSFASDLELVGLREDLISALFYVANWRFIASGQSYFEQFVSVSPVRHTWSLAIEEQFYLVWPVVGLFLLARRRAVMVAACGTGLAVSTWLMYALYDDTDPSRSYFGSGARVHQILVGVILAVGLSGEAAGVIKSVARRLVPLAVLGLAVALVSLADESALYYRGGSLGVAVATGVLVAGLEGGHRFKQSLAARPLVAVGLVSYGVYLWHWPVIQVVRSRWGPTSDLRYAGLAAAITAGLTMASYFIIEKPIRQRRKIAGQSITPRAILLLVPLVSLVALGVVIIATGSPSGPEWAAAGQAPSILDAGPEPTHAQAPTIEPEADTEVEQATPKVAVLGDSVSVSLLPGFRSLADSGRFVLLEAATPACPVGYEPLFDPEGRESPYNAACQAAVRPSHDAALEASPDVVIWHDLQSVLPRRAEDGTLLTPGTLEWSGDLRNDWMTVLDRFLEAGSEVVVVLPPLRSLDSQAGCGESVRPARCRTIQAQDAVIRAATVEFWDEVSPRPNVYLLQLDDVLCPAGNPCPADIDGLSVRLAGNDQTHFTEAGARWVVPLLMERVDALS